MSVRYTARRKHYKMNTLEKSKVEIICLVLIILGQFIIAVNGKGPNIPNFVSDFKYLSQNLDRKYGRFEMGKEASFLFPLQAIQKSGESSFQFEFPYLKSEDNYREIKAVDFHVMKVTKPLRRRFNKGKFHRITLELRSQGFKASNILYISDFGFGWQTFNLKHMFKNYLKKRKIGESKFEIKLIIHNGVSNRKPNFKFSTSKKLNKRALITIFSKDNIYKLDYTNPKNSKQSNRQRSKRDTDSFTCHSSRKKYIQSGCRLEFEFLNLGKIFPDLEPVLYNKCVQVNKCVGSCFLFQGKDSAANSTGHANLKRSYLHHVAKEEIGGICCAPKEYQPVSYLIWQENSIIMRRMKKGKAVSCICP